MRISLGVALALSLGLCFNRLLGLYGLESSLICGLVLGPIAALASARVTFWSREEPAGLSLLDTYALGQQVGLVLVAIPLLVLAANSLRVTQCTPGIGLTYMLLGPGVSVLLCALIGTLCALIIPSRLFASLLALMLPIAADILGLFRLWDTPAIFSYVHTVGYAPGTIYDEGLRIPLPYWSFRGLTLLLYAGIALLGFGILSRDRMRPSLRRTLERPGAALLGLVLLTGFTAGEVYGPELGHRSSLGMMNQTLGSSSREDSERCELIVPSELPPERIRRFGQECDFHVRRLERILAVEHPERIRVFLFRNAAEKQRLMGAGRTYIAKPWRDEIYLQIAAWPHPVLAHELAHIVAGAASNTFLRIPMSHGGMIPNPGLIEGVAVAAAWDLREELTPHQWSRGMMELGELPSISTLMGLSFGTLPARRAYSASGSFMRWILDTRGTEAVNQAYAEGTLGSLGRLTDLEAEWQGFLAGSVPLQEDEKSRIALAMHRRSIFSAVCPHHMADLRGTLVQQIGSRDNQGAVATCEEALSIDPTDLHARTAFVGALARTGDLERSEQQRDALQDVYEAPPSAVDRASEEIADAHWRGGRHELALQTYRTLLDSAVDDPARRRLSIKAIGLEAEPTEREAIFQLLVGTAEHAVSASVGVTQGSTLGQIRRDGLGDYLVGRRMLAEQRYDLAHPLLERAIQRGLPTPVIEREALRLYAIVLVARRRWPEARDVWQRLLTGSEVGSAAHARNSLWLERIAYLEGRD